jgi:BioD-like phosphotransacetylase family protein
VVTLCVVSLSSGAGKTAICAGLGKQLLGAGRKIGYFKPIIGTASSDSDAVFMKESLSLQEPIEAICPSFTSENQLNASVRKALDAIAAGKDVVIVECPGQSTADVAKALSARVIVVADYSEIASLPDVYQSFGATGIVLNKVPVSQVNTVRSETIASFKKSDITVFGVLPEDRALLTFTIAELVTMIDGQVLNNLEKTGELAENFMLGAMTLDTGPLYYSRKANKVAIIRSERADMQMAALETSTRAMVLAGDTAMIPSVRYRAEDRKVPIVTTRLDVQAVASRLEEALVKTRFNQKSKLPRLIELMKQGFDFTALYKSAGIA